jgi:hypothetical protein
MTDKALRLVEELEGLACNGPDNCESGRVMRAAASLIRAQQERIRTLEAALTRIVDGDYPAINIASALPVISSIARAALTEEK